MPLYDYQCSTCAHVVEVRHGFNDVYAEACPACGGTLQRVFNPAPIVFKGSGFYVTDSRKKEAAGEKPGAPAPASSPSSPSDAPKSPSGGTSASSGSPSKESAA